MKRSVWLVIAILTLFLRSGCGEETIVHTNIEETGTGSIESVWETNEEPEQETAEDSVEEAPDETEELTEETCDAPEQETTEEITEETTEEPGDVIAEDPTEEIPDVTEEPAYTVEEYQAVLYAKSGVNVRIGPSTDYEKVGGLNKGDRVLVTGIADSGWYRIEYGEAEGFVSNNYLLDEASYQAMLAKEEEERLATERAEAERLAAEREAAAQAPQEQQPEEQQPAQAPVVQGDYKTQVVTLINQERATVGLPGVSQNASLDAVAQIRAREIVTTFAHTRPNGTDWYTVLDENGVTYMCAGENIAAGHGTPQDVMVAWMNSDGHRANILNSSFGQVGIGYYTDPNSIYGTFWVQIFTN